MGLAPSRIDVTNSLRYFYLTYRRFYNCGGRLLEQVCQQTVPIDEQWLRGKKLLGITKFPEYSWLSPWTVEVVFLQNHRVFRCVATRTTSPHAGCVLYRLRNGNKLPYDNLLEDSGPIPIDSVVISEKEVCIEISNSSNYVLYVRDMRTRT